MRISKLLMPAVTVAGALALAGCGGGSSTPAGDPPPECPAGTTGTPPDDCKPGGDNTPDPATVLELADDLAKATEALEDNTALKTAQDADGKLRASGSASYATSLQGRSASAQAYAQMVLDAKTGLENELKTAREALKDAKDRLATASDVEKGALQRVIDDAEKAIKTVEDTLKKDGDLDVLVMAYTNKGSVKTNAPADRASAYAGALLLESGLVRGTRSGAALDNTTILAGLYGDDAFGHGTSRAVMSLSEILGSDRNDDGNVIAALDGVDLSKVTVTGGSLPVRNAGNNDTDIEGSYQGIAGTFQCYQVNCEAVAADGTIGAGWFFVPTPAQGTFHYVKDGDTYKRVAYVEWGLWMTGTDEPILNAYVGPGRGSETLPAFAGTGDLDGALDDDNKATYSGTATGLSVRTTGSGASETHHSGHFTADVKLNATFHATSPTIDGTVRNFQPVSGQGTAHVNTGWALDLESDDFDGGGFKENGPTGTWTAQAYGGSVTDGEQARPTGVYGTVDAAFSDGAAAGVYHTTKD